MQGQLRLQKKRDLSDGSYLCRCCSCVMTHATVAAADAGQAYEVVRNDIVDSVANDVSNVCSMIVFFVFYI